jgi:phage tail-like protein
MIDLPRFDPLPNYNFLITLFDSGGLLGGAVSAAAGLVLGGFSECRGLESGLEVETYLEGGVNDRVLRFPTRMTYPNLTLTRGVGLSESLWLWHQEFQQGRGTRRDGLIILQDTQKIPIKTWSFTNGLPVKWSGPAFNAGESAAAIESLEIAHEKLELIASPGALLDSVSPF